MGNDQDNHFHEPGRSIAARFPSATQARAAVAALRRARYIHTWLGTTSVAVASGGDDTVTVDSGSGFFSQTHSLVDALLSHGVLADTAREIEGTIDPGEAIVTVDPKDRDALQAISLLEQYGAQIAGQPADADLWLVPAQIRTPSRTTVDPEADYGAEDRFFRRSMLSHEQT